MAIEAAIEAADADSAAQVAEAEEVLRTADEAPRTHFAAKLRYHRALGEREGIETSLDMSTWPQGQSSVVIANAKRLMATTTADLEAATKELEEALVERTVLIGQARRT